MSLKPPWKQENPIMEKAYQVYQKNRAPAEAVEVIDELKVKRSNGKVLEPEVVDTGNWKGNMKQTTVFFRGRWDFPSVVAVVLTRPEEIEKVRVAKFTSWKGKLLYKGRNVLDLPKGANQMRVTYKIHPYK